MMLGAIVQTTEYKFTLIHCKLAHVRTPSTPHRGVMVHSAWCQRSVLRRPDKCDVFAESLAAVRAEEADDLAARLAEAKLHLAELEAGAPGSHQSQAAVSKASDAEQPRQWLPRAISDAASAAMYPTAKLRVTQVTLVKI